MHKLIAPKGDLMYCNGEKKTCSITVKRRKFTSVTAHELANVH